MFTPSITVIINARDESLLRSKSFKPIPIHNPSSQTTSSDLCLFPLRFISIVNCIGLAFHTWDWMIPIVNYLPIVKNKILSPYLFEM